MAVQNHPKYHAWLAALENLIEAKRAHKEGRATDEEVAVAKDTYHKIADEI